MTHRVVSALVWLVVLGSLIGIVLIVSSCAAPTAPDPVPSALPGTAWKPTTTTAAPRATATIDGPEASPMPEPVTGPDEFLRLVRAAGVPVSASGESEVLIGRGVCGQLRAGRSPDDVASELARTVPVWSPVQARRVVDAAVAALCSVP